MHVLLNELALRSTSSKKAVQALDRRSRALATTSGTNVALYQLHMMLHRGLHAPCVRWRPSECLSGRVCRACRPRAARAHLTLLTHVQVCCGGPTPPFTGWLPCWWLLRRARPAAAGERVKTPHAMHGASRHQLMYKMMLAAGSCLPPSLPRPLPPPSAAPYSFSTRAPGSREARDARDRGSGSRDRFSSGGGRGSSGRGGPGRDGGERRFGRGEGRGSSRQQRDGGGRGRLGAGGEGGYRSSRGGSEGAYADDGDDDERRYADGEDDGMQEEFM